MTMSCERCKKELYRYIACNYCGRKICESCAKSAQRIAKTKKLVICKDCWSNMTKRKAFKHKESSFDVVSA